MGDQGAPAIADVLDYNTPIRISVDAPPESRPGAWGIVICVVSTTPESGVMYLVEYEDGSDGKVPAGFVQRELEQDGGA